MKKLFPYAIPELIKYPELGTLMLYNTMTLMLNAYPER
jgi:hypothetical protein